MAPPVVPLDDKEDDSPLGNVTAALGGVAGALGGLFGAGKEEKKK